MSADWTKRGLPLAERIESFLSWAPSESTFAIARELVEPSQLAYLDEMAALIGKVRTAAARLAATEAEIARREQTLVKTLQ
jgi:hypothetical protein